MERGTDYLSELENPVDWLRAEFTRRRERNPQYSLRAFAQALRLKSGPLSEILSGKRKLSTKTARRIAERLGLSVSEARRFLGQPAEGPDYRQLSADAFLVISDWYHFGVLSLMMTENFRNDPKWIAARLKISPVEARGAVERLLRLGLIREVKGRLKPESPVEHVAQHPTPSTALRRFHRQILERTLRALDEVPVEQRDITSMTMAIDVSKIEPARAAIKKFRRELAALLETGKRTEVYHLNVQLVPVTQGEKK